MRTNLSFCPHTWKIHVKLKHRAIEANPALQANNFESSLIALPLKGIEGKNVYTALNFAPAKSEHLTCKRITNMHYMRMAASIFPRQIKGKARTLLICI